MWRLAACAATTILTTGVATRAQSPTTDQTPRPAASSPYWNGNGGNNPSDAPAADIRAVAPARANSVRQFWTHQEALSNLSNAVRVATLQMDREPTYAKAVADEKSAYDAMETARTHALADLQKIPAYAGAEQLRQNVSEQIAAEQELKQPDPFRLLAMARLKIQYAKDNRKLEADALSRDSAFQDARTKYLAAAARVREFNDARVLAVATDDTLVALRRAVASARIEKLAAAAYYDSTLRARDVALNYAADERDLVRYHGYDRPVVDGYGYGAYGAGYGYATGSNFGRIGIR